MGNEYSGSPVLREPQTGQRDQTHTPEPLRSGHEQGLEVWGSACQNWGGMEIREREERRGGRESERESDVYKREQSRSTSCRKRFSTEHQENWTTSMNIPQKRNISTLRTTARIGVHLTSHEPVERDSKPPSGKDCSFFKRSHPPKIPSRGAFPRHPTSVF